MDIEDYKTSQARRMDIIATIITVATSIPTTRLGSGTGAFLIGDIDYAPASISSSGMTGSLSGSTAFQFFTRRSRSLSDTSL